MLKKRQTRVTMIAGPSTVVEWFYDAPDLSASKFRNDSDVQLPPASPNVEDGKLQNMCGHHLLSAQEEQIIATHAFHDQCPVQTPPTSCRPKATT